MGRGAGGTQSVLRLVHSWDTLLWYSYNFTNGTGDALMTGTRILKTHYLGASGALHIVPLSHMSLVSGHPPITMPDFIG